MHKMIYMGGYNKSVCDTVAAMKDIQVSGYISDTTLDEEDQGMLASFWGERGVKQIEFCEEELDKADIVLVNGYTRIIKSELLKKYMLVNIHAGNLPKWRGKSANSWAMLNGENEIAYTIHRVTDVLDGGTIFHKYTYELKKNERYGDGRKILEHMMEETLESVLTDIIEGRNSGYEQTGKYVYCNTFRASDGEIVTWDEPSSYLINKFKVFGKPYGSGFYMIVNGKKYSITDIYEDENYERSRLIPGAVVYKNDKEVYIKTRDTAVIIREVVSEDGIVMNPTKLFYIGMRL